jgi:hypothetical protein
MRHVRHVRRAPGRAKRPEPARQSALRRESERVLRERIRQLLALPMEQRTHFLRVRLPGGGSAL